MTGWANSIFIGKLSKNEIFRLNKFYQTTPKFYFSQQQTQQQTIITDGQKEIQEMLRQIKFENNKDIFQNGYIIDTQIDKLGKVTILLRLDQNYRKVKSLCQAKLKDVHWIKELEIKLAPKDQETQFNKRGGLEKVKKIIAVSSCKGGVGKSTIAVNLAFSLHNLGRKVGIFDADIYGPSLPTMIAKENQVLQSPEDNPKQILAIEYEGVKAMSYGFVTRNKKAVLRGPMVSAIVTQLVYQTLWGDLDYLIVDMPPGTGDIQITLCQELKFDGAVIVTTPQKISFVDVVKGIEMFDELKVPTLSVVENMASFICEKCNHEHKPFGIGYLNMLQNQFGIKNSLAIPLYSAIAKYSDAGAPVSITLPKEHTIRKLYEQLALSIDNEIKCLPDQSIPIVRYNTGSQTIIIQQGDKILKRIKAQTLRKLCHCALCIDEFTGKKIIDEKKIQKDVYPYKLEPKGNYAVAIVWSDGHRSSIYPYSRLLSDQIPSINQEKQDKKTCESKTKSI